MGTERMSHEVAACHCGKGVVIARFWSNDHAFAGDYSWHLSGFDVNCDDCKRAFEIKFDVSNPTMAPSGKIAYFVECDEASEVDKHNEIIKQQENRMGDETKSLRAYLESTIQGLKNTLVTRAESAGAGLQAKFDAIGKALGFSNLSAMRAKVGQTRPSTYVERLVTHESVAGVLSRLGRDDEASRMTETIAKLDESNRARDALRAKRRLPRAVSHFLYD